MVSIILGNLGSSIGSSIAGRVGATIGQFLGSAAGNFLDAKLFPSHHKINSSGARLKDLSIQSSAYGSMIPIVYGTVRMSGNIIWAQSIHEEKHLKTFNYKAGKGAKVSRTHTEYNYSATFAISICEGQIDELIRVWANNKLLNLTAYNFRIHKGTEDQKPDLIIEAIEGVGRVPAYRGQAYIVFEDFPLIDFGNQIPNLTFEVKRIVKASQEESVSELVESVVIIPGSGEFVYDDIPHNKVEGDLVEDKWCQRGFHVSLNQHNIYNKANAVVAMDQLQRTLPKVTWVALAVNWFATDLNLASCQVLPGVEYNKGAVTTPTVWQVANFNRATAHQITKVKGNPISGGTPSDGSILRFLKNLKARGMKVMLYPMLLIDQLGKPWRGHLTGSPEEVKQFFTKQFGYNDFILHYAHLAKDYVDAFIIGSELTGLTRVRDESNNFPAVKELIKLASQVREILGKKPIITYAADWSEYHHTEGGWYNLDELWACPDIDVIGIDAYFPLSNKPQSVYDIDEITKGWVSEEGCDYYYQDGERKSKAPLASSHAWKNIRWWWENYHINPDGTKTSWQPKSKKIWFTEYGFPSVDCCTNQPNVFFDPASSESKFPHLSKGMPDFKAQRTAIIATEKIWRNSDMVERKFLWAWDARPYPYWPELSRVWTDGGSWITGHWIQGKLGNSQLGAVIYDLCRRSGLSISQIECSTLEGIIFEHQSSIRSNLELLQQAYFFDAVEVNDKVEFKSQSNRKKVVIEASDLVAITAENHESLLKINRTQEAEIPNKVDVNFINMEQNYHIGNQHALRNNLDFGQKLALNMPICMVVNQARNIAEIALYHAWMERTYYNFLLSVKHAYLTPGMLVRIEYQGALHTIRISKIQFGKNLMLRVLGTAANPEIYNNTRVSIQNYNQTPVEPIAASHMEVLDLPALPGDDYSLQGYVLIAVASLGSNWKGVSLYFSADQKAGFEQVLQINKQATLGTVLEKLKSANSAYIDNKNIITVNLLAGKLHNTTNAELLNGANMASIGNEIVHFQNARLIAPFQYQLSGFLRGRQGTEHEINKHHPGERFVLIDENLERVELSAAQIGKKFYLKPISYGKTLGETNTQESTYSANSLKPFSPVHLRQNKSKDGFKISWMRRTRLNGELSNNSEVPLGEEKERYICELLDINHHLIKAIETLEPHLLIDNKVLTLNPKFIRIAQLSSSVGKGYESVIGL